MWWLNDDNNDVNHVDVFNIIQQYQLIKLVNVCLQYNFNLDLHHKWLNNNNYSFDLPRPDDVFLSSGQLREPCRCHWRLFR